MCLFGKKITTSLVDIGHNSRSLDEKRPNRERECADTVGTVPVPWAGHPMLNIDIFFQIKYIEAILSNSTPKLIRF